MSRTASSRLTFRTRLALVYGGLFLLAGVVLLAVTYVLVSQRLLPGGKALSVQVGQATGLPAPLPSGVTPTVLTGLLKSQGDQSRHDALVALLTQGGIALAVVGATAVALGWLIAGRMLQPLQRMTETARRIADAPAADRGLHERIALGGPHDEVRELADTFDAMIERLDHSFDGQRRFVANASHELRTPLTLNRALIEVAVRRNAGSPEIASLGETLLDINARHERLIEGLLLLTRAEPEVLERSFVDLADVVEHLACQLPRGSVEVCTEAAEAPTTGDPVLLERLVHNLIENGIRHNLAEGGWLRIASGTRDGFAELVVSNTGQVIPRYEVQQLFEPFHRFGGDRLAAGAAGAGLGLSIVQAVARAHGGDARAEARAGGGLVVTVTLPLAGSVE